MPRWPHDDPASLAAFYGDPASGAPGKHLVPVVPPFRMTYAGRPIKNIMFHKKAAAALAAALEAIWQHYGCDQAAIDAAGASRYDGAYNPRLIRGSATKWSNHAYGAAIDIDAVDNGFNTGHGTMPQAVVDAFKAQGALWGGDYSGRTDPMHFEFCSRNAAVLGLMDAPATDADGDDAAVDDVPAPIAESRLDTLMKLVQSKMAWASTALGGISGASLLGFLTDWRTVSALGVIGLTGYLIYLRSQKP